MKTGSEPPTRIHFTVSMWNRAEHLRKLLADLNWVANVDKRIALHVSFFNSDDISAYAPRQLIENATSFPARMIHLSPPFVNGYGHNTAATGCAPDEIICSVTVDLRLPRDICDRVRANVERGKKYYGPKTSNEDEAGKLYRDDYGYALFAMFGQDFNDIGGFVENKKWGGDNDAKPEGGEDMVMIRRLKRAGFEEARPYERDITCR